MYTPEELAAIKAAERKYDMVRDADHQRQYAEYRAQRAAAIEARRAKERESNPELADRMAAIRARLAAEAEAKRAKRDA